jgi:hypothetical protein
MTRVVPSSMRRVTRYMRSSPAADPELPEVPLLPELALLLPPPPVLPELLARGTASISATVALGALLAAAPCDWLDEAPAMPSAPLAVLPDVPLAPLLPDAPEVAAAPSEVDVLPALPPALPEPMLPIEPELPALLPLPRLLPLPVAPLLPPPSVFIPVPATPLPLSPVVPLPVAPPAVLAELLLVPTVEALLASPPPAPPRMALHPASVTASMPASTTLCCFRFMINSFACYRYSGCT